MANFAVEFPEFQRRFRIAILWAFVLFAIGGLLSLRVHPAQAQGGWVIALRSVAGPLALFVPVLVLSGLLSRVDRILVVHVVCMAVGSALVGSVLFAIFSWGLNLAPVVCVAAMLVPVTTWVCWGMRHQRD